MRSCNRSHRVPSAKLGLGGLFYWFRASCSKTVFIRTLPISTSKRVIFLRVTHNGVYAGWQMYFDWNIWFDYAVVAITPLLAPFFRLGRYHLRLLSRSEVSSGGT